MTNPDQEFLKKLQQAFAFEAKEQLSIISSSILKLEKQQDAKLRGELVEVMFRQAHNLKGSSRAVNLSRIESLCQSLEAALSEMKKGKTPSPKNYLDTLLLCVDILEKLLAENDVVSPETEPLIARAKQELSLFFESSDVVHDADSDLTTDSSPAAESMISYDSAAALVPVIGNEKVATMDSIRLPAVKIDELLLQAEEMLSIKRAAFQHAEDIAALTDEAELWQKSWKNFEANLRVVKGLVGKQLNETEIVQIGGHINKLLSFMEWNQAQVNAWVSRLSLQRKMVHEDTHAIAVGVDSFLESTKKLLLMPCGALLEGFPRLVREVSRDLGKDVELTMTGTEVELDRRILTRMRDPLVHLIRNSIDHGIELPAVRRESGKPSKAAITLTINQDDTGKVEISVSDDGAGIDGEKVAAAAIKAGIITANEVFALTPEEKIDLIFQSALTTSPMITDISGHGLGLAIVKENVTNLGGRLQVLTKPGAGTRFRIFLPVAIATFQGVLLNAGGHKVTVPKANILRVLRLNLTQIKSLADKDAFEFNGALCPLIHLTDLLELDNTIKDNNQPPFLLVTVVRGGDDILGLIVDDVLEEQELMVKKLGKPLNRVRNIAGVTVLRTGEAVPVLHVSDLVKSARRLASKSGGLAAQLLSPRAKKRILVVDDTLTSRMLVKNIMESAGYEVKTAADGLEALAELDAAPFDLVLADVEMPRMDGLELTKRVRNSSKFADLPVILLTSLATREHREKGVQAGATAYFTKGSFDQTNLLDVIKRLI